MLFATLAPSLSMAMAVRAGEFEYLGEICSASKLQTHEQGPSSRQASHDGQKHCPLCLPHASDFQHLPEIVQPDFALTLPDHFPTLFYQSRFLTHTWSPAVARAPPLD